MKSHLRTRLAVLLGVFAVFAGCGRVEQDNTPPGAADHNDGSVEGGVENGSFLDAQDANADDGVADAQGETAIDGDATAESQLYDPFGLRGNANSIFFFAATDHPPNGPPDSWQLFRVEKASGTQSIAMAEAIFADYAVTNSHFVFTQADAPPCPGEGACPPGYGWLRSMPIDAVGPIATLYTGTAAPPAFLAADNWVWFALWDGVLHRVPISGGAIEDYPVGSEFNLVAVTNDRAIYTRKTDTSVSLYTREAVNGIEKAIATFESPPGAVRYRSGFFYWTLTSSHPDIMRIPESGGASTLALPQGEPGFDVSKQIYYAVFGCPDGLLVRANPSGSWDRDVWLDDLCGPREFLVDDEYAYILETDFATVGSPGRFRRLKLP